MFQTSLDTTGQSARVCLSILLSVLLVATTVVTALAGSASSASESFGDPAKAQTWGRTDTGAPWWHPTGKGASWITRGEGIMKLPARGVEHLNTLGVSRVDTSVTFDVSLDDILGGNGSKILIELRKNGQGSYMAWARVGGNGDVWVGVGERSKHLGAVRQFGSGQPTAVKVGARQSFNVRAEALGADPAQVRIKVWAHGTGEPAAWNLVRDDATSQHKAAGKVGLGTTITTDAKNVGDGTRARFDDVVVGAPVEGRVAVTPDRLFDDTPPEISDLRATNITKTAATIRWTTDEPATSNVRYGWGKPNGQVTGIDTKLVTAHVVRITGLKADRGYGFQPVSKDKAGNVRYGPKDSFRTTGGTPVPTPTPVPTVEPTPAPTPDTTAPVISATSPAVSVPQSELLFDVDDTTASCTVDYSPVTQPSDTAQASVFFANTYRSYLDTPDYGTEYFFEVRCEDAAGNVGFSPIESFVTGPAPTPEPTPAPTPDVTDPSIYNVDDNTSVDHLATIYWNTDEDTQCTVWYGVGELSMSRNTGQSYADSFSLQLDSLALGTTYDYLIECADEAGNMATSGGHSFTTTGVAPTPTPEPTSDPTPSPEPSQTPDPEPEVQDIDTFPGVTGAVIRIYASEPVTGWINYGLFTTYGTLLTEDDPGTMLEFTLEGLTPDTQYHWQFEIEDASGQTSSDYQNHTFTTNPAPSPTPYPSPSATPDLVPPEFTDIRESGLDTDSIVIGWDTNEETYGWIYYGRTSKYTDHTDELIMYGMGGSREISGLEPGTTYHYSIFVEDHGGNEAWSDDATFTTLAGSTPTAFLDAPSEG